MVKNNQGGNKGKKGGRKYITTSGPEKTRFSQDPDEIYGCCVKVFGPTCEVLCIDNKSRLCHIRNKFKGRGKRDSIVITGTWVLVGRRSFEMTKENKKENCDLLEVYSDHDKQKLMQVEHTKDWGILNSVQIANVCSNNYIIDEDIFGKADTMEYEELMLRDSPRTGIEVVGMKAKHNDAGLHAMHEDELNIDDI